MYCWLPTAHYMQEATSKFAMHSILNTYINIHCNYHNELHRYICTYFISMISYICILIPCSLFVLQKVSVVFHRMEELPVSRASSSGWIHRDLAID